VNVDCRQIQKTEHEGTGDRERDRAEQNDQGITETLKLDGEHEIDEDDCKAQRHRECTALLTDLPRFASIIEDDRWTSRCRRSRLEHLESFRFGDARLHAAEDPYGVALLEAVQRTRCGAGFNVREGRNRHKLSSRRLDFEVEKRFHRRAILVADLWNDFVAPV